VTLVVFKLYSFTIQEEENLLPFPGVEPLFQTSLPIFTGQRLDLLICSNRTLKLYRIINAIILRNFDIVCTQKIYNQLSRPTAWTTTPCHLSALANSVRVQLPFASRGRLSIRNPRMRHFAVTRPT
jgi:hypothetical protein